MDRRRRQTRAAGEIDQTVAMLVHTHRFEQHHGTVDRLYAPVKIFLLHLLSHRSPPLQ